AAEARGAGGPSGAGARARTSPRTAHSPASRNASSSPSLWVAFSVLDLSRSSSCWRRTVIWARSLAFSAPSRPVGSATTSQPKGRSLATASADSNRPGCLASCSGAGAGWLSRGGAWRPGHGAQTSVSHAVVQSAAGTPLAPGGKSNARPLPGSGPGRARPSPGSGPGRAQPLPGSKFPFGQSRVGDELKRRSGRAAQPAGNQRPLGAGRGRGGGQDVEEVVFGGIGALPRHDGLDA